MDVGNSSGRKHWVRARAALPPTKHALCDSGTLLLINKGHSKEQGYATGPCQGTKSDALHPRENGDYVSAPQ